MKNRLRPGRRSLRWVLNALGRDRKFNTRTKILFASAIFIASFIVKSLHATDLAPIMHTERQLHAGMAGRALGFSKSMIKEGWILYPDHQDPRDTNLLARPPGYPIFLAGVYYFFGGSYFTVQVVQNILDSISPLLIFLIAGTLISWRVGAVAGFIIAVSHHFSYYSNAILPDAPCALPMLIAVLLLVKTLRPGGPSALRYALAGIMLGLSVWLRPNALLMGCFLAAMLITISRSRLLTLKRIWIMALIPFVIIVPITIRNYAIYHEFVPVSVNMGIVLWEGIADSGGGRFGAVPTDDLVAQQEAEIFGNPAYAGDWASPDGIMRDRARVKKSLEVIKTHPFWFAGGMVHRMGDMVKYSAEAPLVFRKGDKWPFDDDQGVEIRKNRNTIPKQEDIESDRWLGSMGRWFSFARPAARLAQRATKETAQLFIAIGVVVLFQLGWRRALFILMVPLYYLLIQSAMHTEFRYTLPIHYFLFICAAIVWVLIGYGASRCLKRLVALRGKRAAD